MDEHGMIVRFIPVPFESHIGVPAVGHHIDISIGDVYPEGGKIEAGTYAGNHSATRTSASYDECGIHIRIPSYRTCYGPEPL